MEEYHSYSDIAVKLFNFMNGNINKMNSKCELYIDMYDSINKTYANIRYPNFIFLHIGTIIDSWEDEWDIYMNKDSYITSVIAWALSHELHHADQLISMIQYNMSDDYRNSIENDVERISYDWVVAHSYDIYMITGIELSIAEISSPSLPSVGYYTRATTAEFYKQTIANIIIRDLDLYARLRIFTDDRLCDNIVLRFNKLDSVVIKSNGEYLSENVNEFSRLAYKYAGYFDTYCISAGSSTITKDGKNITIVDFSIQNGLIKPMIF